jgi:hypothetical protein
LGGRTLNLTLGRFDLEMMRLWLLRRRRRSLASEDNNITEATPRPIAASPIINQTNQLCCISFFRRCAEVCKAGTFSLCNFYRYWNTRAQLRRG